MMNQALILPMLYLMSFMLFSKKAALTDAVAQKAIDRIKKLSAEDGR